MLYNRLHDTLPLNVMISGKCFYGLGMAITRFHHQCFCFGCEILHNTKKKKKKNILFHILFFFGEIDYHTSQKIHLDPRRRSIFLPSFLYFGQVLQTCHHLMLNPSWDARIGRNIRI
jgi:hypothetical protein